MTNIPNGYPQQNVLCSFGLQLPSNTFHFCSFIFFCKRNCLKICFNSAISESEWAKKKTFQNASNIFHARMKNLQDFISSKRKRKSSKYKWEIIIFHFVERKCLIHGDGDEEDARSADGLRNASKWREGRGEPRSVGWKINEESS